MNPENFCSDVDFAQFPEVNIQLIQPSQRLSRRPIYNSDQAVLFVADHLAECLQEELIALMLDDSMMPLCYFRAGVGTEHNVQFSLKQIIRCALLSGGTRIILLHNHPTVNSPMPSERDTIVAEKIQGIINNLGIILADMVIVNQDKVLFSFLKEQYGCFAPEKDKTNQQHIKNKPQPETAPDNKKENTHGIPRIQLQISVTGAEVI